MRAAREAGFQEGNSEKERGVRRNRYGILYLCTGMTGTFFPEKAFMAQTQQYSVTLIGTEGTGKTCFLAGLAVLGLDPIGKTPFLVLPPDEETKRYLNNLMGTLQNGSWMPPTNISTLIRFDLFLKQTKTTLRLQVLDYSGESFKKAFNELTPEAAQMFSEHLAKSKVVLLLLDANDLVSIRSEEDRRLLSEKIRAQFAAVWEKMGEGTDIGILVTKSDAIPDLKHAAAGRSRGLRAAELFVEEYLGDFKDTLRALAHIEGFQGIGNIDNRKIVFFPVSAVGDTDAETGRPAKDKLKPYGYDAVFQWIAERPERLMTKKGWSVALIALIFIVGGLAAAGLYRGGGGVITENREEEFRAMMENQNLTLVEKLEQANAFVARPLVTETPVMRELRRNLVDGELVRLRARIDDARDNRALEEIRGELVQLEELGAGGAENELRLQKETVDRALEDYYFDRVNNANERKDPNFESYAGDFLDRYPNAPRTAEVKKMLDQWGLDRMRLARSLINDIAVSSPSQLRNKMERVGSFLREYEGRLTPSEQEEMRNAMALSRQFLESTDYTVTLKQYGGFATGRGYVRLNIAIGENKNTVHTSSSGSVMTLNPGSTFNVRWQSGEKMELELETGIGPPSGWVKVASREWSSIDAIALLNGRQRLTPATSGAGGWDWSLPSRMAAGGYFVVCEIPDISQEQWKAFEKYIKPGSGWRETP